MKAAISITVLLFILFALLIGLRWEEAQALMLPDLTSLVASLTTAGALIWIIAGVLAQRRELELQREELSLQREELSLQRKEVEALVSETGRQAKAMEDQLKVALGNLEVVREQQHLARLRRFPRLRFRGGDSNNRRFTNDGAYAVRIRLDWPTDKHPMPGIGTKGHLRPGGKSQLTFQAPPKHQPIRFSFLSENNEGEWCRQTYELTGDVRIDELGPPKFIEDSVPPHDSV